MKGFLFDQNLPARLTFRPSLPLIHVQSLGSNPTDSILWNHARESRLVIVSKDADFSDRILAAESPPWLVHLRFGNMRRGDFHRFLAVAWPRIEALLPAHKLICVYRDRIESFS